MLYGTKNSLAENLKFISKTFTFASAHRPSSLQLFSSRHHLLIVADKHQARRVKDFALEMEKIRANSKILDDEK